MLKLMKDFWMEEDGIGTIEIVLILVVLIGLVVIFRDRIETLIKAIFDDIDDMWKKTKSDSAG